MATTAFCSSSFFPRLCTNSKSSAVCNSRLRNFSRQRRVRISAKEKLYPDVDPPEPIDNPLDRRGEEPPPSEQGQSFFEKLNNRRNNRGPVVDTVASRVEETPYRAEAPQYRTSVRQPTESQDFDGESDLNYKKASNAFWRLGWATWWVQLVLTVISGVILLFSFAFPGVNIRSSASAVGFILSAVGIVLAFLSLFWTYSYTRLSLWLVGSVNRTAEVAKSRIGGKLRTGLIIAIVGLAVSLTGMQAIVGTLLARLLGSGIATTPYSSIQMTPGGTGLNPGTGVVQPVDVLVVQACANAMMALLVALTTTVWLRARSRKWG